MVATAINFISTNLVAKIYLIKRRLSQISAILLLEIIGSAWEYRAYECSAYALMPTCMY